jgi:hypothetical protein
MMMVVSALCEQHGTKTERCFSLRRVGHVPARFCVDGGNRLMPTHKPLGTGDPKVDAALGAAVRHLDAAAREQEQAVNRILGLVELLLDSAHDKGTRVRLEGILEACGFQDLCGQRLSKVNRFLRYLASNLDIPLGATTPTSAQNDTLSGPTPSGLSQEQVDRLLRGERL